MKSSSEIRNIRNMLFLNLFYKIDNKTISANDKSIHPTINLYFNKSKIEIPFINNSIISELTFYIDNENDKRALEFLKRLKFDTIFALTQYAQFGPVRISNS